ncbi:MAG: hypothetical protein LH617_09570 [Ramlibacter sp.]|nr:hypothetical protein [Ramlibacter sp.]
MSEQQNFGFGKFVPGFDFLQNLSKGASQSQSALPTLSSWVAPTLNVEELDKRISELKAVHFWLDQNSKALGATIQALELQKMTLATLKGMNFNMAQIAEGLKLKPAAKPAAGEPASMADAASEAVAKARAGKKTGDGGANKSAAAGVVDPMQWWGALTQQFQEIAAGAMRETAADPMHTGTGNGAGSGKAAPAAKTTSRKAAGKSRPRSR